MSFTAFASPLPITTPYASAYSASSSCHRRRPHVGTTPGSTSYVVTTTRSRSSSTLSMTIAASSSSSSNSSPPSPSPSSSSSSSSSSSDNSPVVEVDGVDAYLDTLQHNKDRLLVVKIYAPWCRSCRALTPKVNRLAREYAKDVTFVKMNYEANKELCRRLGIYSMPTFVVYAGEMGEIDKFTCGPTRAYVLSRKIADIHRGFCLLDEHRDKQVQQPAYNKKKTLQQQQQMQWDQELPQEQLLQELRQLQQQQQQERTAQMS